MSISVRLFTIVVKSDESTLVKTERLKKVSVTFHRKARRSTWQTKVGKSGIKNDCNSNEQVFTT